MRFINDSVHGALDYVVALVLIAAPFALDIAAQSQAAFYLSVAAGIGLFLYSLITDYSISLRRLLPFKVHLAIDFTAGLVFLIASAVLSVSGLVQAYFVVMGAGVIVVVLLTNPAAAAQGMGDSSGASGQPPQQAAG